MLFAIALVFLWLRPRTNVRFWPALIPLFVAIQFALPGTLGSIKQSFFPAGGLLAQEEKNSVGSGRLATLGPALSSEFMPNPLLGEGFLTRVPVPTELAARNGPILDNQWLGVLLETGLLGAIALVWLFVSSVRKLAHESRKDDSLRGWLLVAIAASITAYGVGMLTYDSFSFIQVTFLLFIVMGVGSVVLRSPLCPPEHEPRQS
jgi:O-antigen ligase